MSTQTPTQKQQSIVTINTWPTRNIPWIVQGNIPKETVEKLIDAVMRLPVRVRVPTYFTELSLPRYYAIYYEEGGNEIRIIDVIGVRADGSPTKWSYRLGYWHPQAQVEISNILKRWLKEKNQENQSNQSTA